MGGTGATGETMAPGCTEGQSGTVSPGGVAGPAADPGTPGAACEPGGDPAPARVPSFPSRASIRLSISAPMRSTRPSATASS